MIKHLPPFCHKELNAIIKISHRILLTNVWQTCVSVRSGITDWLLIKLLRLLKIINCITISLWILPFRCLPNAIELWNNIYTRIGPSKALISQFLGHVLILIFLQAMMVVLGRRLKWLVIFSSRLHRSKEHVWLGYISMIWKEMFQPSYVKALLLWCTKSAIMTWVRQWSN